jgi:enamidase
MTELVIRNIGRLVTGDIADPLSDADTLLARDGRVAEIGTDGSIRADEGAREIDAGGATVMPGLIDSHVHPVIGDFTPRQSTLGFIESYMHGGVTSMVSAGEPHTPGRPKDPAGVKALAILAAKSFSNLRPGGVKVLAGAMLLEPGLVEEDFAEAAAGGVQLVGEIGISGIHSLEDALPMVAWARAHGMRVLVHTGGASIPGSEVIDGAFVVAIQPDVASHVNGGPTAPSYEDIERIITETTAAIEVVQCGNVAALVETVRLVDRQGARDRLIVGTDSPSGTGVIPLGVMRTVSWLASLAGVEPEQAVAMATGNTGRRFGLNAGVLGKDRAADIVIADAPRGSQAEDALEALSIGDTPAVAAVIIDGEVRANGSRNSPPPKRQVTIPWLTRGGH